MSLEVYGNPLCHLWATCIDSNTTLDMQIGASQRVLLRRGNFELCQG